jgi:fatty acid desaturase
MPSAKELRLALKQAMPKEAFRPQPLRGVRALFMAMLAFGLATIVVVTDLPWGIDLLLAIVIGERTAAVLLCAHESMHGAVFKSRWARKLLAWVGFAPLLVTPGLWQAWHNRAHHRGANQTDYDPDTLASIDKYHESLTTRVRTMMSPGSGHWLAWIGFFCLFTLEGQFFLWIASREAPLAGRIPMASLKLRLSSLLLIGAWVALAFAMGLSKAVFALFIPLAVANLILMSYISTQHWLRPQVEEDDPFCSSMSVIVPRLVDWLHFDFSYHQEHHIFPSMSAKYAPLLREKLREIEPRAVAVLPMHTALREVLRLPVLYRNSRSLIRADGGQMVDLHDVAVRHNLPTRFENIEASPAAVET